MKNLHRCRFKEGRESIFASMEEKRHNKEKFCDFNHGYIHGDAFLRYLRGEEFQNDCIIHGFYGVKAEQIGGNQGNTRVFFEIHPERTSLPRHDSKGLLDQLKKLRRITL